MCVLIVERVENKFFNLKLFWKDETNTSKTWFFCILKIFRKTEGQKKF
jgi:hypothetical protein